MLIIQKMSEYVITFKVKDGDKNNKKKQKIKAIWTKIEYLKDIELSISPSYDRHIKTKIRTYSDKVYTNLRVYTKFHLLVKKLFLQDFNFAVEL